MRHHTCSLSEVECTRRSSAHRLSLSTWLIGAISCMGILTGPAALGSHLTLPGSQDLHHSQSPDNRSFIRHLETINNYITPHPLSDSEGETVPFDEDSAVTSRLLTHPLFLNSNPSPHHLHPHCSSQLKKNTYLLQSSFTRIPHKAMRTWGGRFCWTGTRKPRWPRIGKPFGIIHARPTLMSAWASR